MLSALKNKIYVILYLPKPYLKPIIYDVLMLGLGVGGIFLAAYTLGLGGLMSAGLLLGAGLLGTAWTYIKQREMPWTYFPKHYLEKENSDFYDKAEKNTLTRTEAAYYLSKRWYRGGCDFKLGYTQYAIDIDIDIDSVLHFAARHGRGDLVQIFLANGADPNAKNSVDETPLYIAVKGKQAGVIQLLIGSNKSWDNKLFKIAIKNEDLESLVVLCEANAKRQEPILEKDLPMGAVISQKDNNILKYMIEHFQLDINQYLASPHYMLHTLVALENKEGVIYVLSKMKRGKIDIKNDSGRTARDLAHLYRFSDIEKALEESNGTLTLGESAFGRFRQQLQQLSQETNSVLARYELELASLANEPEAPEIGEQRRHRKN